MKLPQWQWQSSLLMIVMILINTWRESSLRSINEIYA